jgi:hypothetical protein
VFQAPSAASSSVPPSLQSAAVSLQTTVQQQQQRATVNHHNLDLKLQIRASFNAKYRVLVGNFLKNSHCFQLGK